MAEVANTTVQSVNSRTVTRKSDNVEITLWEITDGAGVVWVARKDVANVAQQLIGAPVTMVRRVEQKGEYTNRYLDAIEFNGSGGNVPAQAEMPVATVAMQQAMAAQQAAPVQASLSEKDKQIHRQVAAKVAATIQLEGDTMLDFWSNVQVLARYFDTGKTPSFLDPEVAATVGYTSQVPGGLDVEDDGIPF